MRSLFCLLLTILILSCEKQGVKTTDKMVDDEIIITPILDQKQAAKLMSLPLECMDIEYPNKLNQTIGSAEDLRSPKDLHPAFYGCFDWHSAVHGHWSLVALLKQFPDIKSANSVREKLAINMSKTNIQKELAYFEGEHNSSWERTYGWAWLLKLAEELMTWDDPLARDLEGNLKPLTDLIVQKYIEFLPKLNYPIRVGEHTNTAFGLSFAWDYAISAHNEQLMAAIKTRALYFYADDTDCPIHWEPSGFDFLSPCLEEAALMKRVLTKPIFAEWIKKFMPQLTEKEFSLAIAEVSDRTDGKLVHLDGANFSRAWSLNKIAENLPEFNHLHKIANRSINYSLPNVVGDSYEGGHWLGSFAIYALKSVTSD